LDSLIGLFFTFLIRQTNIVAPQDKDKEDTIHMKRSSSRGSNVISSPKLNMKNLTEADDVGVPVKSSPKESKHDKHERYQ
jgi:hypothetical protein